MRPEDIEPGLVLAVQIDPSNKSKRLAVANWLEANGDILHAKWIRCAVKQHSKHLSKPGEPVQIKFRDIDLGPLASLDFIQTGPPAATVYTVMLDKGIPGTSLLTEDGFISEANICVKIDRESVQWISTMFRWLVHFHPMQRIMAGDMGKRLGLAWGQILVKYIHLTEPIAGRERTVLVNGWKLRTSEIDVRFIRPGQTYWCIRLGPEIQGEFGINDSPNSNFQRAMADHQHWYLFESYESMMGMLIDRMIEELVKAYVDHCDPRPRYDLNALPMPINPPDESLNFMILPPRGTEPLSFERTILHHRTPSFRFLEDQVDATALGYDMIRQMEQAGHTMQENVTPEQARQFAEEQIRNQIDRACTPPFTAHTTPESAAKLKAEIETALAKLRNDPPRLDSIDQEPTDGN